MSRECDVCGFEWFAEEPCYKCAAISFKSELDRQNAATLARLDAIIDLKRLDAMARAIYEWRRELKSGNGDVS